MRHKKNLIAAALALVALVAAGISYLIYLVSSAHGHGLASSDRNAIFALAILAVASAAGSAWSALRRA